MILKWLEYFAVAVVAICIANALIWGGFYFEKWLVDEKKKPCLALMIYVVVFAVIMATVLMGVSH